MPKKAVEKQESSAPAPEASTPSKRKQRLSQSDVPAYSIKEALRVPIALRDEYGKQPTRPLMVAKAMSMTPTGSTFRMYTGASMAYGLTDGAAQGESIGLTAVGKRAIAPTIEDDDAIALREAVLQPQIVRLFLEKYDGSRLPTRAIALNVLEEMGVPTDAAGRAYDMIIENAQFVGYLQVINDQDYVYLDGAGKPQHDGGTAQAETVTLPGTSTVVAKSVVAEAPSSTAAAAAPPPNSPIAKSPNDLATNKRVFVSHGKNSEIVDQIKEVLTFGGFEPVVSVENETVSKPVPDKVMDDMRSCGAGIVHVGTESSFLDKDGKTVKVLNENVLIEIGGAMALYRRNFILLVERDVSLPSNLQGLYQVRYDGDKLDYEATMKLLKAFNDFKSSTYEN